MTPTWPQLAGWLATAYVEAAYGTATGPAVDGDVRFAIDGDRLELRWADGRRVADDGTRAVLVAADGAASLERWGVHEEIRRLLRPDPLSRDDYHRADGPPRPTMVAGRQGWAVDLVAPDKPGHWQLVIDDETGCVLATGHDLGGPPTTITAFTLGADPDAVYAYDGPEPTDPNAEDARTTALFDAGRGPTVHTQPRGYFANVVHADGDRVVVELDAEHPGLTLSVAPIGQQPLDPGPFASHHHTRTVGEHVWLLATDEPISEADADRIAAGATWLA